jgi:hypothetical protein
MNNLPKGLIIFVVIKIILLIQVIITFAFSITQLSFNPRIIPLSFFNWIIGLVIIVGLIKLKNWARILTLMFCYLRLIASLILLFIIIISTMLTVAAEMSQQVLPKIGILQRVLSEIRNEPITFTIALILAIYGAIYFTGKDVEDIFLTTGDIPKEI